MEQNTQTAKMGFLGLVLTSIASGLLIGIAGGANLLSIHYFVDWGRLVGAILFSLAIFAIVTFGLKLYTGMVCKIPTMKAKEWWHLPVVFLFNVLGVGIIAVLLYFSPLQDKIVPVAQSIAHAKLSPDTWYVQVLCSSILCGFLITLSVLAPTYAPKRNLSATLGVVMPIIVFAICGFDHSVANMLYFYLGPSVSYIRIIGFTAISFVGNAIGGVVLPLIIKAVQSNVNPDEQTLTK